MYGFPSANRRVCLGSTNNQDNCSKSVLGRYLIPALCITQYVVRSTLRTAKNPPYCQDYCFEYCQGASCLTAGDQAPSHTSILSPYILLFLSGDESRASPLHRQRENSTLSIQGDSSTLPGATLFCGRNHFSGLHQRIQVTAVERPPFEASGGVPKEETTSSLTSCTKLHRQSGFQ